MRTIKKIASAAIALSTLGFATQAFASGNGKLIINEYNAVGPSKMLQDCADNGEGDIFFDCDNGNGANWIEFVVTEDNLDITGWKVSWRNSDSGVHANNGSFKFSSASERVQRTFSLRLICPRCSLVPPALDRGRGFLSLRVCRTGRRASPPCRRSFLHTGPNLPHPAGH